MQKIKSLFAVALFCTSVIGSARADVLLVNNGKPAATIYVSATPHPGSIEEPPLQTAVNELNEYIQKMSGAVLPVVTTDDPTKVKDAGIVLGDLAVKMGATPEKTSVSKEGFRLLTKGKVLLIGGESDDGTLFGVYKLLRNLGCDWVMPGAIGEIVPHQSSLKVLSVDDSEIPGFQFRNLWYSGGARVNTKEDSALFSQWMHRNGGGNFKPPAAQTSGHFWGAFIHDHQKEFDADPSMYALVRLPNGDLVRKGPQLESTNPKVVDMMVADIKSTFARNNWPHDKTVGFPIGPSDGGGFSVSTEAQLASSGRRDPQSGGEDQTDLLILLGNQIWDKIKDEYPNVYLGYYSYAQYQDYPARYKPNPHMAIIFAPIAFSRYHSVLDPHSKSQAYYRHVVEEWHELSEKQGNPLIFRGYNFNLADDMLPYSKLKIWGDEIPFYHNMGFIGLNVESQKVWSVYGPSNYVFMQLAWDPSLNWKDVLHTYCQHAFGAGAASMEKYFLRLAQNQSDAGQEAGSYHAIPLIFNADFMARSKGDLAQAMQNAKTANDKTRIHYVTEGFHSLELYLDYFNASTNFDFASTQKYFQQMVDHQNAMLTENPALVAAGGVSYLNRFLKQFVEQGAQYSSGQYRLVQKLPDAMPTIFDPYRGGEVMEYFNPQINDRDWLQTKTYSSTWDAQGLGNLHDGAVWYRYHFDSPQLQNNQNLGLFLGGFDDEARVWLNGVPIGASNIGFSKPATYDLSSALKKGDNLLAIEIVRNSKENELGTGGIIRPSFLFAGPKLEKQAAVLPVEYLK
jgi:hypothetical protein